MISIKIKQNPIANSKFSDTLSFLSIQVIFFSQKIYVTYMCRGTVGKGATGAAAAIKYCARVGRTRPENKSQQ